MTREEARPKYTKDSNVNEMLKEWPRSKIKRYNDFIKVVRLGRITEVSKQMEIDSKIKYAGMSGVSGVRNSLGEDGDSDDSDDEDLEAYDGFAGELTAINIERTSAV